MAMHVRHLDGGGRYASIVGTIISSDAFGPIVDNARGLAEMGGLGEETIRNADALDSAATPSRPSPRALPSALPA